MVTKLVIREQTIEARQWFQGRGVDGVCFCALGGAISPGPPHLHTDDGYTRVSSGDWIVVINGRRWVMSGDLFAAVTGRAGVEQENDDGSE